MKSSMPPCGDIQSDDYIPCEIPCDHKKSNYKHMKLITCLILNCLNVGEENIVKVINR